MNDSTVGQEGGDQTMADVAAVSLRLLAGAVPRHTMQALQRTIESSPAEYPWQVVTKVVLEEPVDAGKLVQQGLRAQRDWIQRGGRETPGKSASVRAKTFVAKLTAQAIIFGVFVVLAVLSLLLIKHKWPEIDVYVLLEWFYGVFPSTRPS
jgi:hypothetical protein